MPRAICGKMLKDRRNTRYLMKLLSVNAAEKPAESSFMTRYEYGIREDGNIFKRWRWI